MDCLEDEAFKKAHADKMLARKSLEDEASDDPLEVDNPSDDESSDADDESPDEFDSD